MTVPNAQHRQHTEQLIDRLYVLVLLTGGIAAFARRSGIPTTRLWLLFTGARPRQVDLDTLGRCLVALGRAGS